MKRNFTFALAHEMSYQILKSQENRYNYSLSHTLFKIQTKKRMRNSYSLSHTLFKIKTKKRRRNSYRLLIILVINSYILNLIKNNL